MKLFNITWSEIVDYSAEIEAEDYSEAKEIFESNSNFDSHTEDAMLCDDSLEIEEVR